MIFAYFSNFGIVCVSIVIIVCTLINVVFAPKMAKRKRQNSPETDEDEIESVKIRFKDEFSTYKCRHVDCNCAPDPNTYRYDSRQKQWRTRHENSMINDHFACREKACSHCFELFGVSANDLLKFAEFRQPAVDEIERQNNSSGCAQSASSSSQASTFRRFLNFTLV